MRKRIRKMVFLICMLAVIGCVPAWAATVTQEIRVNTSYSGQLTSYNDVRQYYFTLDHAGKVNISFFHANNSSTKVFWNVKIYNQKQQSLLTMKSRGTDTEQTSMDVGLEAGRYYVQVECDYFEDEGYRFIVNYTASDCWETEENDGYGTADEIAVNTRYSGACQYYNDEDYYKFVLPEAGSVSVSFEHPILNDTRTYWKIHIYNEKTQHLAQLNVNGTTADCTSARLGLEAGNYYVHIECDYHSSVTYSFQVNYTASDCWESEENDGYGTADPVSCNIDYSGACQFYNDEDYYKFTLNHAGKISVRFQHPLLNDTRTYWKISVRDEQTNTLLELRSSGTEYDVTTPELGLPAGSYYLVVNTDYFDWSTYNFRINNTPSDNWETELNDGYGTADPIVVGAGYSGAIQRSGDHDYYRFQQTQPGEVNIRFSHPKLEDNRNFWRILLHNEQTETLLSLAVRGTETSVTSPTVSLAAGIYYIEVYPDYYYSTATYTLSVNDSYATSKPTLKALASAYNKIKLTWNRYSSASGYVVYRSTSRTGTYREVRTIGSNATTAYTDTKVTPGKTYYYKIRPYRNIGGTKVFGSDSSVASAKAAPPQTTVSSIKAVNRKAVITWKKQKNISGYEVYMSTKKKGGYRRVKTLAASKTRYVKSGLAKGKTYYFKVRSYKTVKGKKIYGEFGSVKKVKIKK